MPVSFYLACGRKNMSLIFFLPTGEIKTDGSKASTCRLYCACVCVRGGVKLLYTFSFNPTKIRTPTLADSICPLLLNFHVFLHALLQIFIDRDSDAFVPILNYLRTRNVDFR